VAAGATAGAPGSTWTFGGHLAEEENGNVGCFVFLVRSPELNFTQCLIHNVLTLKAISPSYTFLWYPKTMEGLRVVFWALILFVETKPG